MNQVLMRSINTSIAAVLPVLSLLVLGSWILGVVALEDFALALLVGLLLGAYSSIFIATPLLAIFKQRDAKYRVLVGQLSLGAEMTRLAGINTLAARARVGPAGSDEILPESEVNRERVSAASALTHPPRPRKKRSRT